MLSAYDDWIVRADLAALIGQLGRRGILEAHGRLLGWLARKHVQAQRQLLLRRMAYRLQIGQAE